MTLGRYLVRAGVALQIPLRGRPSALAKIIGRMLVRIGSKL